MPIRHSVGVAQRHASCPRGWNAADTATPPWRSGRLLAILRETLANGWVWLLAACLLLFSLDLRPTLPDIARSARQTGEVKLRVSRAPAGEVQPNAITSLQSPAMTEQPGRATAPMQ